MVSLIVLLIITIALAGLGGYAVLSTAQNTESFSLIQRNALQMEMAANVLRANVKLSEVGQWPRVPAGEPRDPSVATSQTALPRWIGTEGTTPWGVRYGYCPFGAAGAATANEVYGRDGAALYRTTLVGYTDFAGTERQYVEFSDETKATGAPEVLAFVISPALYSDRIAQCDEVVWDATEGRFVIASGAPNGTVTAVTKESSSGRLAFGGNGDVVRYVAPAAGTKDVDCDGTVSSTESSGTATLVGSAASVGSTRPKPTTLMQALKEWDRHRPQSLTVRFCAGEHILDQTVAGMFADPDGLRNRALDLIGGPEVSTVFQNTDPTGTATSATLKLPADTKVSRIAFTAIGLHALPGTRLRLTDAKLRWLYVDGAQASAKNSTFELDTRFDRHAARVDGGELTLEVGTTTLIGTGGHEPVLVGGGDLVVRGDIVATTDTNRPVWRLLPGGRALARPLATTSTVSQPKITLNGAAAVDMKSHTSSDDLATSTLGSGGGTTTHLSAAAFQSNVAVAGALDIGLESVSQSCTGASCAVSCPTPKKVVTGGCTSNESGAMLSTFGPNADRSGWSCQWSTSISAVQPTSPSASAVCARTQ